MWQMRVDMSRDECRKCLRCLELDAYGNVVSVLRAQGPLTDDKKRLLGELAKVLHISNERHRAEVRRAVNDEKLSVIAEQLNGPNTWTDWAIEGRRTIPLLPRLKAHTAFTGLANSLSLVIATANEKKVPYEEKRTVPVVKTQTEPPSDVPNDHVAPKPQVVAQKTRGRKRKKSTPDNADDVRNAKISAANLNNHGAIVNTRVNEVNNVRKSPSPLPVKSVEIVDKNEPSPPKYPDCPDVVEEPSNDTSTTCTVPSPTESHSTNTTTCQLNRTPDTASSETNCDEVNADRLNFDDEEVASETKEIGDELNDREETEGEEDAPTASNFQRIQSTNECAAEPTGSNDAGEVSVDNSESAESSGPGPPDVYNHMRIECLNDEISEKNVKLNSNNAVNVGALQNPRLSSKTNLIVVQKGLKLAGKEVLDKVIVDGKNLRISGKPLALLPHRTQPNNNETTNAKSVETVILDIRQDSVDSQSNDSQDIIELDTKTILINSVDEVDEEDVLQVELVGDDAEDIVQGREIVIEENEHASDVGDEENCTEVEETFEITEEPICGEILIEQGTDAVILDAQTEIYNFESTDDNVCEIQIEETVPASSVDIFSTAIASADINLESYTYEEEDTTEDDTAVHSTEQLNQLDS